MGKFLVSMGLITILSACNFGVTPEEDEPLEAQANFWRTVGSGVNQEGFETFLPFQAIALDSNDNPYVAIRGNANFAVPNYVKFWNGSNWQKIGNDFVQDIESLVVGNDNMPVVLLVKCNGEVNGNFNHPIAEISVKRWDGSTWVSLGGPVRRTTPTSGEILSTLEYSITVDTTNRPIVAWKERIYRYNPAIFEWYLHSVNLYVSRWNGNTWTPLGTTLNSSDGNRTTSLAIDSTGNPYITWKNLSSTKNHFMKWNGTS